MASVFVQRLTRRSVVLFACESVLITGAVVASSILLLGAEAPPVFSSPLAIWKNLLIALVCQLCLYYADSGDFVLNGDSRELLVRILQGLGASAVILAAVYFWFPWLIIGQGVVAVAAMLAVAIVVGWRMVFMWVAARLARRRRILLLGTNAGAIRLARELQERGIEIVGMIDVEPRTAGAPFFAPGVIGTIDDIPTIVRERSVERVVVSLADARGKLPMATLLQMKLAGVRFDHLASVYEEYTGKIAVENLRPSWLIFAEGFRKSTLRLVTKRVADAIIAAVSLLVLWPLLLLLALAVKLTSRGPVLYHQQRVGQDGRLFNVHKFRSMREQAELSTGPVWAQKGDNRVTRIGGFLRRARLDELPQLWNILCGQMSIVGPRPERPEFVTELTQQIPFYAQRHVVKPGLTGWSQVSYPYGASVEDAMEKLQYDLFYIKHMSLWLDFVIGLATIKTVLLRRGT
jgi:sugar transferase (PEP-CTERM system associated)